MRKTPETLLTLHHVYSRSDIHGNIYWITTARSTISGRSISFTSPSNSKSKELRLSKLFDSRRVMNTSEQIGIRDYWRRYKTADMHNACPDDDIISALKKLAAGK